MEAIKLLVNGKTDSELLETLVACLTDNAEDLIKKLEDAKNYNQITSANLKVLAAIVRTVAARGKSQPATETYKCILEENGASLVVHVAEGDSNALCGVAMVGQQRWKVDAVPDCPRCLALLAGKGDEHEEAHRV